MGSVFIVLIDDYNDRAKDRKNIHNIKTEVLIIQNNIIELNDKIRIFIGYIYITGSWAATSIKKNICS
jgi:hypothetical protein